MIIIKYYYRLKILLVAIMLLEWVVAKVMEYHLGASRILQLQVLLLEVQIWTKMKRMMMGTNWTYLAERKSSITELQLEKKGLSTITVLHREQAS